MKTSSRIHHLLFRPVDIASLVIFRIGAGALISIELINAFFSGDFRNYVDPAFNFSYQFFPWLKPFPEAGMYALFIGTILAGFMVSAGFLYRFSAFLLFLGQTAIFLMEETEYVNHAYLYCLVSFFLILIPAHRAFSIDAARNPAIRRNYAPAWALYILLFQISVVYFYAGLAKLHADWFRAAALKIWMSGKTHYYIIGKLLGHVYTPFVMSYVGLVFDLLFVPLLLWRRTRLVGFAMAVVFHLSNVSIFGLATFPWFSMLITSLFFSPGWPRRFNFINKYLPPAPDTRKLPVKIPGYAGVLTSGLLLYALVQILLPFRHFLYPGNVNWTEEGHKFAWHMMLRTKSGYINYQVRLRPEDTSTIQENPAVYLTNHQLNKLPDNPDFILQFAHFLADKYRKQGYAQVQVFAQVYCSLNGRPYQPIVDERTDLAQEKRGLHPYPFIVPLAK